MADGGGRSMADDVDRANLRCGGSSSIVHQIKWFKLREHHLDTAELGVGRVEVKVARKWLASWRCLGFGGGGGRKTASPTLAR